MIVKDFERIAQILIALCTFGLCVFWDEKTHFVSNLMGSKINNGNNHFNKLYEKSVVADSTNMEERELFTHTECTSFLHPSLRLKYINDNKKYGIIATQKIAFGSIISVETPMFIIEDNTDLYSKDGRIILQSIMRGVTVAIDHARKHDSDFKRIWDDEFEIDTYMMTKYPETMKENSGVPLLSLMSL